MRRWTAAVLGCVVIAACGPSGPRDSATPIPTADARAASGGINAPRWRDAPYVVMVSLDGFASRYVTELHPPRLEALGRSGIWARDGMIPSYPSKTFPNHYTLVTGLYPAHHGLVANTFFDPERDATYRIADRGAVEDGSWYGGEPLWVTAEKQGMVAASMFWVGSEAAIGGVRPSYWERYDEEVPDETRVERVLSWLRLPPERRPHLVTLYFSDTDNAGHEFGPDSPELRAAVAKLDGVVGQLLDSLRALSFGERVNVLVMADHGMDGYTPATTVFLEDVVSMEGLRVPESGPDANVWVDGGPARVREIRDRIDRDLPHVRAFLPNETPARLHYRDNPRIGDLVLMPDSGWVVIPVRSGAPRGGFTHGWDPAFLSMRALFVGAGPGLAKGREIPPFENVQVYPLVARLLGLEPAAGIDGDPAFWDDWLAAPGGG